MINRIIDISETQRILRIRNKLLEICKGSDVLASMPPKDVACLLLSSQQTTLSVSVLSTLSLQGAIIVTCDDKHLPAGMMFPLQGNHLQQERIRLQCSASPVLVKRLWQTLVQAKITGQAECLEKYRGTDFGLRALSAKVRTGDSQNIEGRAAAIYWKKIFGHPFVRDRQAENVNIIFNYGYTVLRAMVARAICAVGLHPSIGLNHHNRYDLFALADDLIEPFRPCVDDIILSSPLLSSADTMSPAVKQALLHPLITGLLPYPKATHDLFHALLSTTESLTASFKHNKNMLRLPSSIITKSPPHEPI